ncbi:MAG: phosphotransferase family protein [Rhodospirillales bacterium]|nr:phosphotransferase family protein [Rhodospirillales bacterium]
MENVRAQFDRIPLLKGYSDTASIERLGGLTNLVYRIGVNGKNYILRLAGEGTEEYIDRAIEGHNAKVAAEAGVSAEVFFFDASDGLMLADFIEGETMSPDRFAASPGAPARAANAFKALHECGLEFNFRFELFSMIDEYLKVLAELGATLPEGYNDVVTEAEAVRHALDAHPAKLTPCHCDPLCENFIDDGARMWIVDWEYSGMNDPLWDLGCELACKTVQVLG